MAIEPAMTERALRSKVAIPRRALVAAALLLLLFGVALFEGLAAQHSSSLAAARHRLAPHKGLSSLPMAAQGVVSATVGADNSAYRVSASGSGFQAQSAPQRLHTRFGSSGVQIASGSTQVGLSLRAVGYGASLQTVGAARPSAKGNRVTYARAGLSEWYANGPIGLEQGFTIPRALANHAAGPLTLSMALSGNARAALASGGRSVTLSHAGGAALRYGSLTVTDASGRMVHSWLDLHAGRVLLRVDTRGAHYPLRIDPLIQQGTKLTGGGEVRDGLFGYSVALSSDGNTALIGGPGDIGGPGNNSTVGAAWVFTRSGSTWTQQGAKLTGGGETGEGWFGWSVALSSDGNTALIGGPYDNASVGAAWVFMRSNSTWAQASDKLTGGGEVGKGQFGDAVALSSDGNTALIGGECDQECYGAAWAFTRSGLTWTQQGSKLLVSQGEIGPGTFGRSVALSTDGNTALIGAPNHNGGLGAAWAFTRSGATWTQQGMLTGSGEISYGMFGSSVALSTDGDTALVGGLGDNSDVGAAWAFMRSGPTWTQQGEKLTGGGEVGKGKFGWSVALSADDNTALIGGRGDNSDVGAAWLFTRSGSTWAQQGEKLTGSGESGDGHFGSVALSSDGNTALIGGPYDNALVGAAWVFVATLGESPTVTKVSPAKGAAAGGTKVTITGTNFTGATDVKFGSVNATSFIVKSPTSITAISPAEVAKSVDVTVMRPGGTSTVSSLDHFKFGPPTVTGISPNNGSKAGGTTVTVTGTGFGLGTEATLFKFGTTEATTVSCTSNTACHVAVPSHAVETVDVRATVSGQKSPKSSADQFTYN